jgi:hypothetical protein
MSRRVVKPMPRRGWPRGYWVAFAVLLFVLFASCTGDRRTSIVPAGRGELLASGKLWGETWSIYCGIDTSADQTVGFDPAPRGACATRGHEHPCVQVEYLSGMVRCQLEELTQRLLFSHSLPGPDEDRFLFFGVLDSSVARVEFKLKTGSNLDVRLIEVAASRFKLFVTGITREQGKLLERPLLWDAAGNLISGKAS